MREIQSSVISAAVRDLCLKAAFDLPEDVMERLKYCAAEEESEIGASILRQCVDNAHIAANEERPICQDTGFAVFFIEQGQDCRITGETLFEACNAGVRAGYTDGYLRKSIVRDPLFDRKNTGDNTPAVVHVKEVPGSNLRIVLAPKGGGSENMSRTAMLKPADGPQGVVDFVVDTVVCAGGNPCPPTIVGVGIGGTLEKCCEIAKHSLLRPLGSVHEDPRYADLEKEILERVNASGVGPQGLGGSTTALAVHIETHPCHIAQLPVAVNLNCHAARHSEVVL
ncbi:MAG: fumarate hydratase [Fibrobacterota bacterium]